MYRGTCWWRQSGSIFESAHGNLTPYRIMYAKHPDLGTRILMVKIKCHSVRVESMSSARPPSSPLQQLPFLPLTLSEPKNENVHNSDDTNLRQAVSDTSPPTFYDRQNLSYIPRSDKEMASHSTRRECNALLSHKTTNSAVIGKSE